MKTIFAPIERLLAALTDASRRERTVIFVLAAYTAVWTLYGTLSKASQDIHTDMAEMVAWSRELALGYPKHPPFGAWLARAWFTIFPTDDWSFYLLAMTVAAVGLWIAWRAAGDYLDGERRVLALAALTLVPFFNFHALKYNANTVLIPLWAGTTWCFLRSYERRSAGWAALAGLFAAGAMLGKYWSIFLLAGLVLAALLDSRRAAYFRSAAPWMTIAVGAAALAPHVIWLFGADFAPIRYAQVVHAANDGGALHNAVSYVTRSFAYIALAMLLLLGVIRPGRKAALDILWPATPERRLVVACLLLPFLLPILLPLLDDINVTSLWSMSAWTLLPVMLLSSPLVAIHRPAMLTVIAVAIILPPVMVAAAPTIARTIHRGGGEPLEPAAAHSSLLAGPILHEWQKVTGKPLRIVGGDEALAFGVAFYLPSRPSAFAGFRLDMVPWLNQERLRREGAAVICAAKEPGCLGRAASLGLVGKQTDITVARTFQSVTGRPATYSIVIVPPAP